MGIISVGDAAPGKLSLSCIRKVTQLLEAGEEACKQLSLTVSASFKPSSFCLEFLLYLPPDRWNVSSNKKKLLLIMAFYDSNRKENNTSRS